MRATLALNGLAKSATYAKLLWQKWLYRGDRYTKAADRSPSRNKFDFKGHLQETPKPISDQNLFSRFPTVSKVEFDKFALTH